MRAFSCPLIARIFTNFFLPLISRMGRMTLIRTICGKAINHERLERHEIFFENHRRNFREIGVIRGNVFRFTQLIVHELHEIFERERMLLRSFYI